ncbi:hypothetical protein X949_5441 [Burkholderia pseudomallei MSHR5609]|nr:hypothetical protein X949_5441 [Burkholderia pseudomallei MSHR5609]
MQQSAFHTGNHRGKSADDRSASRFVVYALSGQLAPAGSAIATKWRIAHGGARARPPDDRSRQLAVAVRHAARHASIASSTPSRKAAPRAAPRVRHVRRASRASRMKGADYADRLCQ